MQPILPKKQMTEDGFLAPFKVINVTTDISDGWRPRKGQLDIFGKEIPDRTYTNSGFDYNIVIEDRIQQVAAEIDRVLADITAILEGGAQ